MNNNTPNNVSLKTTAPKVTTKSATSIKDIMISNLDRLKKKYNIT